jgi:murein DD-endopeptidase MepM/ murein hydrolase activator NlpD
MRQQYFVLVLAHSLHGRLRRVQISHRILYFTLAGFLFAGLSLFGICSSYLRMTWKVANYNSLRRELDTLRSRYQSLQKEANQKNEQLASLQLLANEVSLAYGIKRKLEGPPDIASESRLTPTFRESLAEYDFLKSARYSMLRRNYARQWQTNVRPSLWPVFGRVMSPYGSRTDPFSGEGAIHTGVDLSASLGTPVRAAADGIVTHAEWSGRYGKLVIIDHGNGMQTWYAHLSQFEVVPGQEIRQGQLVALSGRTGRTTAPHLHYEVRVGGNPINPWPYLTKTSLASVRKNSGFSSGF